MDRIARNLYDGGGAYRGVLVVDVDFVRISNRFHGRTEARGSLGLIADQDMNLLSHLKSLAERPQKAKGSL